MIEESLCKKNTHTGDLPFHRPPYGLTTDKQLGLSNEATEWRIDDRERFIRALKVISVHENLGLFPGNDNAPSAYSVGNDVGIDQTNPTSTVNNILENKDLYHSLAEGCKNNI